MDHPRQHLHIVSPEFTVERLPPARPPGDDWIVQVRAPEGLTVVRAARPHDTGERWIGFYGGATAHDLDVPGMLAAIVKPLADAAIPVFVASTFDADLVLVPRERREEAVVVLEEAGHRVEDAGEPVWPPRWFTSS
ncbi:ACT domain-containing protein [Nonomuraea sp. PA05]|uniref:ACT domain-containing protein n=1 Tax=Nonomuraea sp. PA05 TaxID=2604466 RepID=UPI0011D59E28|nr:ACT domain-containing protein [Nonomuraea sp. PA05]TYB58927.1 ACT domain-containing protein [Nonomuraea sp. PA05]